MVPQAIGISLRSKSLETQETLWIGNVYGPIIHGCKEELWTQLEQQIHGTMQFPCIIAGDFNDTIYLEEKKRISKVKDPFGEILEDIMSVWRLVDIKPKCGKYTWSNKHLVPGHISEPYWIEY